MLVLIRCPTITLEPEFGMNILNAVDEVPIFS